MWAFLFCIDSLLILEQYVHFKSLNNYFQYNIEHYMYILYNENTISILFCLSIVYIFIDIKRKGPNLGGKKNEFNE
jgi:hypothetical protein